MKCRVYPLQGGRSAQRLKSGDCRMVSHSERNGHRIDINPGDDGLFVTALMIWSRYSCLIWYLTPTGPPITLYEKASNNPIPRMPFR